MIIRKRSTKVLFRFTISYLLLMVAPLLVGLIAYAIATRSVSEQIIYSNELALSRSVSEIECCLTEAQSFTSHLNKIDAVAKLLDDDYQKKEEIVFLRTVISNLSPIKDTYGLIRHYLIYAEKNQIIFNNENAYVDFDKYYRGSFCYKNLSWQEFQNKILKSSDAFRLYPVTEHIWLGSQSRSILYVLPVVTASKGVGKVLIYIDEAALLKRIRAHFDSTALVGILQPDGSWLYRTNEEIDFDSYIEPMQKSSSGTIRNSQNILSFYYSPTLKATVLVAVPNSYIYQQMSGVRTTMLLGLGVIIAIGLILALILFCQNRMPLAAAIDSLPDSEFPATGNSLHCLAETIKMITDSNALMVQTLQIQRFALRSAVVNQLIQGGGLDENKLENQLRYVGICPEGDWFHAVILHIGMDTNDGMNEFGDLKRAELISILSGLSSKLLYLDLQNQSTCAMLYVGEENESLDESLFLELYRILNEIGNGDTIISVGSCQHSLSAICHSFLVAEQQLERADGSSWLILHDSGISMRYHYSPNDEQKLFNLIATNRPKDASQLLAHLREENFVKKNITGFERELLYFRIIDTIIQAADEPGLFQDSEVDVSKLSVDVFFSYILEKLELACSTQAARKASLTNQTLANIYAYIQANYTSQDICLMSVAMNFGLTEKYFSAFFKEKAGINFSTYLENLRIKKATELLMQGQLSTREIASAVGYASPKSFSRAYLRCTGKSPSQVKANY